MKIIDGHCDVLWKIWEKQISKQERVERPFYNDAEWLQVTREKLRRGRIHLQACAIYISEEMAQLRPFETALEMVEIFYTEVVSDETILIKGLQDLNEWQQNDKLGLILTLEGAEAVGRDLVKLRTLHRLGVRWVGLTHNPANHVADGVGEDRGAGLSSFGREFVQELNRLKMAIDVSHLSEKGFWDVMALSTQPIFASHSNMKVYCDHPRNLSDAQVKALIEKDGLVSLTFVPKFTSQKESVTIDDLLRHVEHVCSLGGEDHLAFGSDFDGISETIIGLNNSGETVNLVNELLKHYREEQVHKFLSKNWFNYLTRLWS